MTRLFSVGGRDRRWSVLLAGVLLCSAALWAFSATRASSAQDRCETFAAQSLVRAGHDTGSETGSGASSDTGVAVIGDSYSVGLKLAQPLDSWPSRLPGRVHVAGFSGSGFSEQASDCGPVSFADRASEAIAGDPRWVVVEGGLNDFDQSAAAISAGFARLMMALQGRRVVVVGPASAPSRIDQVPRLDALLRSLSRAAGVPYLSMAGLDLDYLPDQLHLTPASHEVFGDRVADWLRPRLR